MIDLISLEKPHNKYLLMCFLDDEKKFRGRHLIHLIKTCWHEKMNHFLKIQ